MNTLTTDAPVQPYASLRPDRQSKACWFWAGWEPDRYYKRIGARTTLFFGNGDWIADWRMRLESPECLAAMQESGASILITRFAKGFGPAVDSRDWASLKRFVSLAHDNNLKVWGYLQGQSIFGEFLFLENPEAKDWIALAFDGSRRNWGGVYNRFAPCLSSRGFRSMIESLVEEGLSSVKLDGLHMDNSYYAHCYCPRCKSLFREWLDTRGDLEQITGIERADFVEPPPLPQDADILPDPLAILWIEFGVQQRLEFMKAIREKVKQIAPQAHFTGNPAFLRSFASRLTHGYDPAREHEAFDSVCVENGNRPRFVDGVLFTQADKHLMAEAGSLHTWVTSWGAPSRNGDSGYEPPMSAQSIWAGVAEEFSFNNAFLGNNWALRPVGDGGGLVMDALGDLQREFERAVRYFRDLEAQLGTEHRRQWGELVIYLDTRGLALCPASDCRSLQAFIAYLLLQNIPFKIVFQEQALPAETRTVLIVGQRCLSTSELERLTKFTARDDRQLWLLGECGTHDEWFVPRGAGTRHKLFHNARIRTFDFLLTRWLEQGVASKKYFKGLAPSFSREGIASLSGMAAELRSRQQLQITAPEGILANVELMGKTHLLVHLRDLREHHQRVEASEIRLLIEGNVSELRSFSPTWEPNVKLPTLERENTVEVCLNEFTHYACLAIANRGLGSCEPPHFSMIDHKRPSKYEGSYQKSE